jgi:3-methyladenine DNA glycosylase AlkD
MSAQKGLIQKYHQEIRTFLTRNSDPAIAKKYARYFKEGYDPYGVDPKKLQEKRAEWFKLWQKDLSVKDFLELCEGLLKSGKWEEKSTAINFMTRLRENYNKTLFNKMGKWFEKYIDDWATCDVACGHVLYHFITDKIVSFKELLEWTESSSRWKRRAVPVTMVELVSKHDKIKDSLIAARKLILDPEKVVHQGVGWMLRETWKKAPKDVEDFLYKWKDKAPRLIIQYATEKIPNEKRKRFRRTVNRKQ